MPFCTKCGTEHSDEAKFCSNCGNCVKPQPTNQQYFEQQPFQQPCQQPYYMMKPQQFNQQPTLLKEKEVNGVYGLGLAIAGTILSFFAFIFAICSLSLLFYIYDSNLYDTVFTGEAIALNILFAMPLTILSIIFGGNSIKNFKYAKAKLDRVPVPTLVMGIHSLVMGIMSALFTLSFFTTL